MLKWYLEDMSSCLSSKDAPFCFRQPNLLPWSMRLFAAAPQSSPRASPAELTSCTLCRSFSLEYRVYHSAVLFAPPAQRQPQSDLARPISNNIINPILDLSHLPARGRGCITFALAWPAASLMFDCDSVCMGLAQGLRLCRPLTAHPATFS